MIKFSSKAKLLFSWIILIVAIASSLFIASKPSGSPVGLNQKVAQLSSQFRCPTCIGLNAEQSNASTARAIRHQIKIDLEHGQSPAQIKSFLLAHYGPMILMKPPTHGLSAIVWILPFVVVIGAIALITVAFRRWKTQSNPDHVPTLEEIGIVEKALGTSSFVETTLEQNSSSMESKI